MTSAITISDPVIAIGIISGAVFWLTSVLLAHRTGIRRGILIESAQRDREGRPRTSLPIMITRDMRQQLYDLGHKRADVDAMTPGDANRILHPPQRPDINVLKAAEKATLLEKAFREQFSAPSKLPHQHIVPHIHIVVAKQEEKP